MSFRADDLLEIITVNRPTNTIELDIVKCVVSVGGMVFVEENPIFPYTITINREQSKELSHNNPVNVAIYYNVDGQTIRSTCEGTFNLKLNPQVVPLV